MLRSTRALVSRFPALGNGCQAAACEDILAGWRGDVRQLTTQIIPSETAPEPVDEAWWQEVQGAAADAGGSGDAPPHGGMTYEQQRSRRFAERLNAPVDSPRKLGDYRKMVLQLSRRKRAYLIRDVVDEMSLNGVRPDRFILQTGLFACMKNRKLGDAMYFFEGMKKRGMQLDNAAYCSAISACGRAGHVGRATELRDEMLHSGLEMTLNIRLAMLHAFAEAGRMRLAREEFAALVAAGHRGNEFAYAGLANCYRHMSSLPADAEAQLLALLEEYKTERAAVDAEAAAAAAAAEADSYLGAAQAAALAPFQFEPRGAGTQSSSPFVPLLVVFNAVLNSLVEMGRHETAKQLYASMGEQGLSPDHVTYGNIIRSYLQQALGRGRQPQAEVLTALLEAKMKGADMQLDMEAVLAEDPGLAAALEAAAQREAAAAAAAEGSEPLAAPQQLQLAGGDNGGSEMAAAEVEGGQQQQEEEEEEEDVESAALRGLGAAPTQQGAAGGAATSDGDEEEGVGGGAPPLFDLEPAAGGSPAEHALGGSGGGEAASWRVPRRQQRKPYWGLSRQEVLGLVRERASARCRSRLRFEVFRQHLDLDSWYETLDLYQQVLDKGLTWGPDITYTMLKAALDLQAAGVEDALLVAHAVMDTFDRQGLFVDVENGSEVLLLAVRRDVGDLSLAHRIYDSMRKTLRVPKTACLFKYMRAMSQREPDNTDRLIELCARISSDPDRSERVMPMKREAWQRKQQILAATGREDVSGFSSGGGRYFQQPPAQQQESRRGHQPGWQQKQ